MTSIDQLRIGDKITVTMVDGTSRLGDYAGCERGHLLVESQASRTGTACLVAGIAKIEKHDIAGPCGNFAGTGTRCTTCRMRKAMH